MKINPNYKKVTHKISEINNMFNDVRSKKIVLIAHCILNQNSISDGTADYPASIKEIVNYFIENDIGILQLPCPELNCLGLDRGNIHGAEQPVVVENTRIRNAMVQVDSQERMYQLVQHVVSQVEEYIENGFTIIAVVGMNRSPSCGVETTSMDDKEVEGEGLFITALKCELDKRAIDLNYVGIKGSKINEALTTIDSITNQRDA